MKSLFCRVMILAVAALVAAVAGQAQANTIVMQDFENLDLGSMDNQDGWVPSYGTPFIGAKIYELPYGGKTVKAAGLADDPWIYAAYSKRLLPGSVLPLTFDSTDTAIEQHMIVYADTANAAIHGGLAWDTNGAWATTADVAENRPAFGIEYSGGVLKTYLRTDESGAPEYRGDTVYAGNWYELMLVMDFSTAGGTGTLWYRNITDPNNIPAFTRDTHLVNSVGVAFSGALNVPDYGSDGVYTADGIHINFNHVSSPLKTREFMDKFWVVDPVPEPSTLAMLACGLIGLLAYAWRKRR